MTRLIESAKAKYESFKTSSLDSVIQKEADSQRMLRSDFIYFYPPPQALEKDGVKDMLSKPLPVTELGIYVHLPFCIKTCTYCHYVRYEKQKQEFVKQYVDALKKEWEIWEPNFVAKPTLHSLHIGGGTPTYMQAARLGELLTYLDNVFGLAGKEVTCETHPLTATESKLKTLLANGTNRINVGIQTFDDELLASINRGYDKRKVLQVIEKIRNSGFNNINVDLIYGLPNQTLEKWESDLEILCNIRPESVSLYALRIKPTTEISRLDKQQFPTAKEVHIMYLMGVQALTEKGYTQLMPHQFVISQEHTYQHQTLLRARNRDYLGLGIATYSFLTDFAFFKISDIHEYISAINKGTIPFDRGRKLSQEEAIRRHMILGFFYSPAVRRKEIERKFNINLEKMFEQNLHRLVKANLIEIDEESIKLTLKGRLFSTEIVKEFYCDEDKRKLADMNMKYGAFLVDEE